MSALPEMCPPDEVYDGKAESQRFATITIEKAELSHLMAIALSVYGYLELGQPDTAIRDAYAHYSAFCSSSTKVLQRMAREKAASDKALKSLFDVLESLSKYETKSNQARVVRAYKIAAKFFVK